MSRILFGVSMVVISIGLVKIAVAPLEVVLASGGLTAIAASVVGSLPFFSKQL